MVLRQLSRKVFGQKLTPLAIAKRLLADGICIFPEFLSIEQLHLTREDLNQVYSSGIFKLANTGRGASLSESGKIRRDEIYWLERSSQNSVQGLLWQKIEDLKTALNRSLFLNLQSFEGHYAVYPDGGFYERHLDKFQGGGDRIVSFILYLNQNWQPSDGGQLRVHTPRGTHTDINPEGGKMVCFISADFEHEVLLNHSPRFSFCGWFKDGKN